jgi:type IV pilus biogenesis protein CpaD/CtpE
MSLDKIVTAVLVVAACLAAGCASRPSSDDGRAAIPAGSGITVFGTIDAGVSRRSN